MTKKIAKKIWQILNDAKRLRRISQNKSQSKLTLYCRPSS